MKCNSKITIYHQNGLNENHFEKWDRYNYDYVWFYSKENAEVNKGYNEANSFDCRIPYDKNSQLNIANFSMGDIVVEGHLNIDIESQTDLSDYSIYNITSISNNKTGCSKHIHIGGK